MTTLAKADILKLYKSCLIYVNTLKYSDKDYIRQRLRTEFRNRIDDKSKLDYYYNKGKAFLERERFA